MWRREKDRDTEWKELGFWCRCPVARAKLRFSRELEREGVCRSCRMRYWNPRRRWRRTRPTARIGGKLSPLLLLPHWEVYGFRAGFMFRRVFFLLFFTLIIIGCFLHPFSFIYTPRLFLLFAIKVYVSLKEMKNILL